MGSEWSWPCGDRLKIKYKPSIYKTNQFRRPDGLSNFKMSSIQVIATALPFLNQELNKAMMDYIPVTICNHPFSKEEALIIYQQQKDTKIGKNPYGSSYASEFSFTGIHPDYWKETLEKALKNPLEAGQIFLGLVGSSNNYSLSFFKPSAPSSFKPNAHVFFLEDCSKASLQSFLNSSRLSLKTIATYKSYNFLIMQNEPYPEPSKYYVYEFSRPCDNIDNFECTLASRIESYIENNLDFLCAVTTKSVLSLVFKLKSLP